MSRRLPRRGAVIAWLLLGFATTAGGGPATGPDAARRELSRLVLENRALERRLQAASGDGFYLVLDLDAGSLRMMLEGVVLREYALRSVEVGLPRLGDPAGPARWPETIWTGGRLDPVRERERIEILAPDGPSAEPGEPEVPPTPEEIHPLPPRYRIRYDGGLEMEIRPAGGPDAGAWSRLRAFLGERVRSLAWLVGASRTGTVRVRLDVADAGALYRALPPETRLLILPAVDPRKGGLPEGA